MTRLLLVALFLSAAPLWSQSDWDRTVISPVAGSYEAPVTLGVTPPNGASVRYRFLETPGTATFPWSENLVLDAHPGETRTYSVRLTTDLASGETVTRDYRYTVSRKVDPIATVQPEPGRYVTAVTVTAHLPPHWSAQVNGGPALFPLTLDAPKGRTARYEFVVAGPQGQLLGWTYQVDRRDQEALSLEMVSPREGIWANSQPLVAVFRGVDQVLWSYGPSLDPATSQEYTEPVLLDRPGLQTVTLAARSRLDGTWMTRTLSWTNGTAPPPVEGWPSSGVVVDALVMPSAPGLSLSWDEGWSWESAFEGRDEKASLTTRKVLSVQLKQSAQTFRYVYWLDARAPLTPQAEFVGGWNPRVNFSSDGEASHRITWTKANGEIVEEPGLLWGPVGSWKVPDGVVGARLRTLGCNGLDGPPVSLGFAETGWSTPLWEPWDQRGPMTDKTQLPLGGRVLPRQGFWPVFSVSENPDLPEPSQDSGLLIGAFLPSFPLGSDRTLYVRFAWRDASGLVGPGSEPFAVRVDRVPPAAPDIVVVGSQVLVKPSEGEEDGESLLWAATAERVTSAELLAFQPYRAALDLEGLRSGAVGRVWFHAQSRDRAGNLGASRLNVALLPSAQQGTTVVQVDSNPAVGEIPVEDGGVYPWPLFRLRAIDPGKELWVGVSDDAATVPIDWSGRVQPWVGTVNKGIARGERRTFLVYWNARTPTGWAWETPKLLKITLDLAAPSAPTLSGEWPSAPLGQSWSLRVVPGRAGDTLRYTATLDGTPPPDPAQVGSLWPGTQAWDAPPGGRVVVRVRFVAVSVSGLTIETALGGPVTIDRSPPSAVSPGLEPFTYSAGPQNIPLPPSSGNVRYTITSDGQLPPPPTETSSLVPASGLTLEGLPGESLLYRFWWRPYSVAGVPGPLAGPFGVLVDRTAQVSNSGPVLGDTSLPTPSLSGLPALGLSAVPVTLVADKAAGLLRYEVREGLSDPRPVTALSSPWTGPLVLDGGAGVDRSFAVSIRLFSPEGRALSEEVSYSVRVDRSIPTAPLIDLVTDTRRAEAVLKLRESRSNTEESLSFRWSWKSFPVAEGQGEWTNLNSSEAVFLAPGGAITQLRVEAFWTDIVGNRGPVVERTVLIDQNAFYLEPKGTGDGSRGRPAGTVSEAIDRARREGKSILLVGAGSYAVGQTLNLGGFQVYGGLAPSQWESTTEPGRSLWTAAPGFSGASLLESTDSDWSLENIDLSTGGVRLSQVVSVKAGRVLVRNANWVWSGAPNGWAQAGGSVTWSNVSAAYTAENRGSFLNWESMKASIRGLRVAASQNQGGVLISFQDSVVLLQDLVLVSKNAKGYDGLVSAIQSQLTVDQARIQGGDGADRATGFLLRDTEATLWNTEVSLYGAAANTGYQSTGGRLEVHKGSLSLLKGTEFNQGLVLDDTQTVVRSFELKIDTGSYQGGISVDGGHLTMSTATVALFGGGQRVWGAQFLSEVLVLFQDVTWTLKTKTPGDLWTIEKPWAAESSTQGNRTTGW